MNALTQIKADEPRLWLNSRTAITHCDFPRAYLAWQAAREQRDDCQRQSDDEHRCGGVTSRVDYLAQAHDDRAGELSEWMAEEIAQMTGLTVEQLRTVFA